MPPMKKPSQQTTDAFEIALPPTAERRKMFGMPAAFVNGNMMAGVFEDSIMVRLPEKDRAKLVTAGGAPFAPMDRPMKEYVTVPAAFHTDAAKLRLWLRKALAYADSLPPKAPKARKKAAPIKKTA